jgi:hypothetical protein
MPASPLTAEIDAKLDPSRLAPIVATIEVSLGKAMVEPSYVELQPWPDEIG